jgi:hypothetical protein
MPLPDQVFLRRGHLKTHFGLSDEEIDDLIATGILRPRVLPLPAPEKLPAWRRKRLPKTKRAVFLRSEVTAVQLATAKP